MDSVTLEFDHNLAEHLAARRLYYQSTLWWKADKVVAFLLISFGVFLLATAGFRWWTIIWFPLAIAEWFNLLSIDGLRTRIFFKRNPKFLETYHLTFSDVGVHFKTASIDSTVSWSYYTRVLENDAMILLIYGTSLYTVIPKRAFRDDSQLAAFNSIVNRYVLSRPPGGT
jgi:hypothetical protein